MFKQVYVIASIDAGCFENNLNRFRGKLRYDGWA